IALPSPGGIGTFHAIGKVILEGLGYPTQKALSAMLVVHGFQYFLALLVGIGSGLYLLSLSYAKSHHSES
ncbi:MAG: lysylphosphatidylglycerol synthase domain-containing protein, partial [Bacteroidia bacterium]